MKDNKTGRAVKIGAGLALCLLLAACGGDSKKVKFSEKDYGVKASPRMVKSSASVPKGGGRSVVGKPYKVAGKWYYPKDDPNYKKTGYASWYGPTFHGRMTANGEIFDRYALTAAHTTFPLPSYARVTNVNNGRSMIVRVNDRGPFHDNRVIDLSERVADMLGTKQAGVAKVKVEYVGRAPLHGKDEKYLLASLNNKDAIVPGATQPGTMLAYNAPQKSPAPIGFGNVPVPTKRPYAYDNYRMMADAAGSLDPATVYTPQRNPVRLASNQDFNSQINSVLSAQPAAAPANVQQPVNAPSGILPPGTLGYLPASANTPNLISGNAELSYAPVERVEQGHSAFAAISGGLGLKTILEAYSKQRSRDL
ncbi:septal ring lytic transglycosylase RlpA family protein [Rhodobacteraceae bacterium RKSG542]|nr:septal ring lytic transglycosylase RlpA family protein [Pseudovibrio flavus]